MKGDMVKFFITSTNYALEMTVRMISIWILALFYRLGKWGEEKDTDKVHARNILQSTALIPKTFFNYVTFLFQNMKYWRNFNHWGENQENIE